MSVPPPNPNRRALSVGLHGRPIAIGLVNNMPDQALAGTERQFRELLTNAAGNLPILLRIFSIDGVPRSDAGRRYVSDHYEPVESLWGADLDGLIVTGTEPRAPELADEPYWPTLTRLVDWATEHAVPSIWSCLAAHAAVQHLDGIQRITRAVKLSGVFECVRTAEHPLVRDAPARWCTPHSRYNDLSEEELASHGYQILVRSPAAGADLFIKQFGVSFLFMQGHPEYEADVLLREYRRDISRFLAGVSVDYPEMPCGYFGDVATAAMMAFRAQALRRREKALIAEFPMALAQQNLLGSWQAAASRLYANWLSYLVERKLLRGSSINASAANGAEPPVVPAYG
jgi:homoserine O-succinyltransferase/O-acetyltransferase